ncbi:hypothetical protein AGLY_007666 [Aphis glycines]|uniref:Uncharacterized protein n=1 Tax=Aphis glycines TaxID=307491 RepID=A0A6G0TMN1_APHGL|nr:hypothetical protein AGLY_007666 [Aphis glycines]
MATRRKKFLEYFNILRYFSLAGQSVETSPILDFSMRHVKNKLEVRDNRIIENIILKNILNEVMNDSAVVIKKNDIIDISIDTQTIFVGRLIFVHITIFSNYVDMSFQLPSVKDPMVTNNISYKVAKENHENLFWSQLSTKKLSCVKNQLNSTYKLTFKICCNGTIKMNQGKKYTAHVLKMDDRVIEWDMQTKRFKAPLLSSGYPSALRLYF